MLSSMSTSRPPPATQLRLSAHLDPGSRRFCTSWVPSTGRRGVRFVWTATTSPECPNLIGFVFQDFFLLSGTTALENVAQGLLYRGIATKERRERAAVALARVGLEERMDHLPTQLSGGERQRVAIARAILGNPAVVFADEPTGNLDSKTGAGIVDVLLDLNGAGTTVVVITHDREVAGRFGREVSILDGRIAAERVS